MFVVQTTSISGWQDVHKCREVDEAQEYIRKLVHQEKIRAENYRILKPIMHCKTRIEFILDSPEEKTDEDENEKVIWAKNQASKKYNDEELKLLYFERSCELKRWAKTSDFPDPDRKYPPWHTYQNYIGSKSNILDMIVHELKLNKDQVPAKYQKIIDQYYPHRSAEHVIKRLNEG